MRNHWHFVIWPRKDGELTAFVRWLSHTRVMRWHVAHGTVGCGSLYQGRFKSACGAIIEPKELLTHRVGSRLFVALKPTTVFVVR